MYVARGRSHSRRSHNRNAVRICYNCKAPGHFANDCKNKVCSTCKKIGHSSNQCFRNNKCNICNRVGHTPNYCNSRQTNLLMGVCNSSRADLPYVDALFKGVSMRMLVDTGAAISVISPKFVRSHFSDKLLEPCNQNVIVADGRTLAIHSCLKGNLFVNDRRLEVCLYVCDIHVDSILGMDVLSSVGLKIGEDNHLIFAVCSNYVKKNKNVFYKTKFHTIYSHTAAYQSVFGSCGV